MYYVVDHQNQLYMDHRNNHDIMVDVLHVYLQNCKSILPLGEHHDYYFYFYLTYFSTHHYQAEGQECICQSEGYGQGHA